MIEHKVRVIVCREHEGHACALLSCGHEVTLPRHLRALWQPGAWTTCAVCTRDLGSRLRFARTLAEADDGRR